MSISAAIAFSVGGVCMKLSAGLSEPLFSFLVYLLFGLGATIQTFVIYRTNLGGTYIVILGLEAVITLLFSVYFFKEEQDLIKLIGLAMIIFGVILLRGKD
jgi:multidrug transporter EmrE-like cation transporter